MPNSETFRCEPIKAFVNFYLKNSKISIDPFARNFQACTYTNDLNPQTKAQFHMDSIDFLLMLKNKEIKADLVIFDPPYSPTQMKECYESFGLNKICYAHRTASWTKEKNILIDIILKNGVFLYFGWNTEGMGKKRGFSIEEILIVSHGGGGHNDTLCMAERKTSEQKKLITN